MIPYFTIKIVPLKSLVVPGACPHFDGMTIEVLASMLFEGGYNGYLIKVYKSGLPPKIIENCL